MSAGIKSMVEGVAMLHVVQVYDDEVAREGAGGLVLRSGLSARHREGEGADEKRSLHSTRASGK
jgi:hypothetical protein